MPSVPQAVESKQGLSDESVINQVSGVYYGDDITSMLPSGLAFLGHANLKMLWYGRRSEAQLLNYHIKGVLFFQLADDQQRYIKPQLNAPQVIKLQGPMIHCVDTSVSMKGKPELIARANHQS